MLRTIDIVMIGLLLGGAAFTFKVKHDSEEAIERVAKLEKKIKAEQDAIDVLKADWSLLTDPKRLAKLVERYGDQLGIEQLDSSAIGDISEIPMRPPVPAEGEDGISALLEGTAEPTEGEIITGTVEADKTEAGQ